MERFLTPELDMCALASINIPWLVSWPRDLAASLSTLSFPLRPWLRKLLALNGDASAEALVPICSISLSAECDE